MTGGIESDRSVLSKNSCSLGKNIQFSAKKIVGNILASNLRRLIFEATTLPTEPRPLPTADFNIFLTLQIDGCFF